MIGIRFFLPNHESGKPMIRKLLQSKLTVLLVLALASTVTVCAADKLKSDAKSAIKSFKRVDPDLKKFFDEAAGYAILPSIGEGGVIIGGQHGEGLLYEKGKVTGKVTASEVSVGAQVGGGSFSEVIFFETSTALEDFKKGQWQMS